MNPYRTCQENMDALKKVLIQRTYVALANKNVEFVLKTRMRRWTSWPSTCASAAGGAGISPAGRK